MNMSAPAYYWGFIVGFISGAAFWAAVSVHCN